MEPPGGLVIGNKLILKSYNAWKNRFGQVMGSKPVQTNTLFPVITSGKILSCRKKYIISYTHQEKYFS
ncbi:hypothetical protein RhiirA1_411725 [Rhizophagus irregularis]|uniref:Uncharacterized protein n=1 Tax=Rhizophagus irregularis TaxID=588596 RepID=A0A2N0SAG2_9GLOM|nr:hypothetical protein RhiirA1_411725 [Rhizophagus irregularis]